MKKTLITLCVAVGSVLSIHAQGIVTFNNNNGTKVSTNSVVDGSATAAADSTLGTFYYALFASTTATTVSGSTSSAQGQSGSYAFSDGGWTFQSYGTNTATGGRFLSSTADASGSTALTFAGGQSVYFTVLGWSANIGSTIASLESYLADPTFNAYVGESGVSGAIVPGIQGSTPPAGLFGAAAPFLQGFTLGLISPVPEPATMALAALGGASLLLFRRKK